MEFIRRVAAVVSDSTWLKLAVLVPVCGALWVLAGPIADAYNAPGLVWPLRGMAMKVALARYRIWMWALLPATLGLEPQFFGNAGWHWAHRATSTGRGAARTRVGSRTLRISA